MVLLRTMSPPANASLFAVKRTRALFAAALFLVASCSLLNRGGDEVTCEALEGGRINSCEGSVIASCSDGVTVTYKVCDTKLIAGDDVCEASWQTPGTYRCALAEPVPLLNACGNGTKADFEGCDDGNLENDDGCDSNCTETACGNGIKAGTEACDDGNVVDGDGCDSNCTETWCGNGVKAGTEACDDGNLMDDDGCDSNCTVTACGNGVKAGTEVCDDGNAVDGDGCDSNCTKTACGNGVKAGTEVCDDGNLENDDGCDSNCTETACGNGVKAGTEACDDGNVVDGDGCDSNCIPTGCGNGIKAGTEVCDDGNIIEGDACDPNCKLPACGNGYKAAAEACDDGNVKDGDGCDSNCTKTACGNGIKAGTEACDDGNLAEGDACDPNCKLPACGNGYKTVAEACDAGTKNAILGECSLTCVVNNVLKVADGYDHTCALVTGGKVRCWGEASYGQLGYGNTTDLTIASYAAGFVSLGEAATDIVAGNAFSCALLASGSVRCWGAGANGRLGLGNTLNMGDDETPDSNPVVSLGGTVKSLSTSSYADFVCAVLTTGAVRCWGAGAGGQLGYGNTNDIGDNELPSSVAALSLGGTVDQVSSSSDDYAYGHSCAVLTTGAVRCWGLNYYGQLGYGNTTTIGDNELPSSVAAVSLGGNAKTIATSGGFYGHTCVVLTTGAVRCWGRNNYGQLGYGNTITIGDNELPSSVGTVSLSGTVSSLILNKNRSCAFLTDGRVQCWGTSYEGYLGYGNTNTIGDDELPSSAGTAPMNAVGSALWPSRLGPYVLFANGTVKQFRSTEYPAYDPILAILDYTPATLAASATKIAAEAESNNTQASADYLNNATVDLGWGATLSPVADQDYFKITVAAGKSLRLRTTTLFDATTCPGNTLIRLYDPNGAALGFDDDDGLAGGCSLIDPAVDAFAANLAAGTYSIRVEEQGNDATIGPYQLLVEVL